MESSTSARGTDIEADIRADSRELVDDALADVKRNMVLSEQQIQRLTQDIETLKKDQRSLSEALIASAARARQLDDRLQERERRLDSLLLRKHSIERSFTASRHEITTTLAALERIGLKPPPAIISHPDDALQSLRSSILLGSMMHNLHSRADNLRADLDYIRQIEQMIRKEKAYIADDRQQQQTEKTRLQLLFDEKKTARQQSEQQLTALQQRTDLLAQKAQDLQELINEMEKTSPRLRQPETESGEENDDRAERIVVSTDFLQRRGQLSRPVEGIKMQSFDNELHGELYETSPGAVITTPADGVVRYAGLFRSYGQLLIVDVGQNYHLILAGMGQIHVGQGQFLLAGEPVGIMEILQTADELAQAEPEIETKMEKIAPMLYVEIRKDGVPTDPASWWQHD